MEKPHQVIQAHLQQGLVQRAGEALSSFPGSQLLQTPFSFCLLLWLHSPLLVLFFWDPENSLADGEPLYCNTHLHLSCLCLALQVLLSGLPSSQLHCPPLLPSWPLSGLNSHLQQLLFLLGFCWISWKPGSPGNCESSPSALLLPTEGFLCMAAQNHTWLFHGLFRGAAIGGFKKENQQPRSRRADIRLRIAAGSSARPAPTHHCNSH